MDNAATQHTTTPPSEVYGQLLPLDGKFLILPKAAVLEVLGMEAASVETGGPGWLVGMAGWHGKRLPVISYEAMAGDSLPARSRRTRLVVINGFGGHLENDLFMILAQGYPHLTALNAAAMVSQIRKPEDAGIALSRVRLASTQAIIPDLENIALRIASALSQAGGDDLNSDWEPGTSL